MPSRAPPAVPLRLQNCAEECANLSSTLASSARHPPRPSLARAARRIPGWLLRQMLLNNAVSAAVGLVPFVGDVVLAMYKANSRNAALLEEFLRVRGAEFLKAERERAEDPQTVRPGAGRAPVSTLLALSAEPLTSESRSKASSLLLFA